MPLLMASYSVESKQLQVETLPAAPVVSDVIRRFYVHLHIFLCSLHPFCLQAWGPAQGELSGIFPAAGRVRTNPVPSELGWFESEMWGTDSMAGERALPWYQLSHGAGGCGDRYGTFSWAKSCWSSTSKPLFSISVRVLRISALLSSFSAMYLSRYSLQENTSQVRTVYLQRREREIQRSPNLLQADGPTSAHSGAPPLYTLPAEEGAKPFLLDPYLKFQQLLIFAISIGL